MITGINNCLYLTGRFDRFFQMSLQIRRFPLYWRQLSSRAATSAPSDCSPQCHGLLGRMVCSGQRACRPIIPSPVLGIWFSEPCLDERSADLPRL